jgi:hypothetical protein
MEPSALVKPDKYVVRATDGGAVEDVVVIVLPGAAFAGAIGAASAREVRPIAGPAKPHGRLSGVDCRSAPQGRRAVISGARSGVTRWLRPARGCGVPGRSAALGRRHRRIERAGAALG